MDPKRYNRVLLAVAELHRRSGSLWRLEHDVVTQTFRLTLGLEKMASVTLRDPLPPEKEHASDEEIASDVYAKLVALRDNK